MTEVMQPDANRQVVHIAKPLQNHDGIAKVYPERPRNGWLCRLNIEGERIVSVLGFCVAGEFGETCALADVKLQAWTSHKAAATLGRFNQTFRLQM